MKQGRNDERAHTIRVSDRKEEMTNGRQDKLNKHRTSKGLKGRSTEHRHSMTGKNRKDRNITKHKRNRNRTTRQEIN